MLHDYAKMYKKPAQAVYDHLQTYISVSVKLVVVCLRLNRKRRSSQSRENNQIKALRGSLNLQPPVDKKRKK